VLSTWHFTRVDPYSYSAAGHVWNDHEWLAEVALAFCYGTMGVAGLKLMKCLCTAATIVLIAMGEAETGASETVQFCVLMIAAVALGAQMQFRPQLFTFIFFAATLWILARDNYGRRAPLWLIAVMMMPWVNLHGGFFIGLIALVIYTAVATIRDLYEERGWNHGLRLVGVTIATIAATLATPYGLDNWYAVTHTLHNPLTRGLIQEWEPLLFVMRFNAVSGHSGLPLYIIVLGLMGAFVLIFALSLSGGDLPLVVIGVVMIAAAFMSVRNMALAVIAICAPLARHSGILAARWRAGGPVVSSSAAQPRARYHRVNQAILTAIAIALLFDTGLFSRRLPTGVPYPAGAVAFMKAHGLNGNLLCDFNWFSGGFATSGCCVLSDGGLRLASWKRTKCERRCSESRWFRTESFKARSVWYSNRFSDPPKGRAYA
jgi:hypothetical protein